MGDPATRTLTAASGEDYTYTQDRNWTTEEAAFFYNNEQINIAVVASGGAVDDVSITLKGTNYVVPSGTNLTVTEWHTNIFYDFGV